MFHTVKDLKAAHVVGARLEVIAHWQPKLVGTLRTINKVQRDSYRFLTDGDERGNSWSPFPKRSEVEFHADGSFTIRPHDLRERDGHWTLRFIADAAEAAA